MKFVTNPKYEGKEIEVVKASKGGKQTTRELLLQIINRLDRLEVRMGKLEARLDNIVKKNNLKE